MKWEIIVLLPKGGGDYHGIGLLEPFWKVIEKNMVAWLLSVKFHDSLHGGLPGRGTGTATIEAKLHQSLAWCNQCPLYQIYVDLKKAYDVLVWEQMLKIFGGLWSWAKVAGPTEAFLGDRDVGMPCQG
jgi:hypothetical protein